MFKILCRPVLRSLSLTTRRAFAARNSRAAVVSLSEKLNRVDEMVRATGRVPITDFLESMNAMTQPGAEVSPIQGLLMLRCCGSLLQEETPEKRNELAEGIWSALEARNVQLDISHYNVLLRTYIENKKQFDPFQFLVDIEAKGIQPNRATFDRLIHKFCLEGNTEGAGKLLVLMKERDIALTQKIFHSLILGYIKAGDIPGFEKTIELMKKADLEVTSETLTAILSAAADSAENPQCLELFNKWLKHIIDNNVYMSTKDVLDVAVAIPADRTELLDQVISLCTVAGDYNVDCYNCVLELVNRGKFDHALKMLKTMRPSGQDQSGTFMIRQMVRNGADIEKVLEICQVLKDEGLHEYSHACATEAAFTHRDLQTSRKYLKHFIASTPDGVGRPHYYWPLLVKCKTEAELMEVINDDMKTYDKLSGGYLTVTTFEDYVWAKNLGPSFDPILVIKQLKESGFSESLMMTALVNNYLREKHPSLVIELLKKNKEIPLQPKFMISSIASAFVKNGTVQEFASLLTKVFNMGSNSSADWVGKCLMMFVAEGGAKRLNMEELIKAIKDLPISSSTLDVLKEQKLIPQEMVSQAYSSRSNSYIKSSTIDINGIDGLENHLLELKSRNMDHRQCLKNLIQAYCKKSIRPGDDTSQLKAKVNSLVEELKAEGFEFRPGLKSVLMNFYASVGDLDKMKELKSEIDENPEFILDYFKVLNLVTALIKNGQKEEALNILREECRRPRSKEEPNIDMEKNVQRNVFTTLNTAAEVTKDPKFVDELSELTFAIAGIKKPTNIMAGPLVKVRILNNDLKGAVDQFAHMASLFNILPWKSELMKLAIEADNPDILQLLTDLSVKIHGEFSTLTDILVSFIKANRIDHAKRVAGNPRMSRAGDRLLQACEMLAKNCNQESNETLAKLIEITKDVPELSRDEMYFQLIRGYAAVKDPQQALNVWTSMQEEGVVPSEQTLAYLGSFLEESGVNVPFDYKNLKSTPTSGREEKTKTNGNKFANLVREGQLNEALTLRNSTDTKKLTLQSESTLVEKLLEVDRNSDAVNLVLDMISKGSFPQPRVLRSVVNKLTQKGETEEIKRLESKLPGEFKNQSWFTNQLAFSYIAAGKRDTLVDEVLPNLKPIPLAAVLHLLQSGPEFELKVKNIAEKLYKEKQQYHALNMFWTHYMIEGRLEEASEMLEKVPEMKENLLFAALVKKIKIEKDIKLADSLIEAVRKTNLSPRAYAQPISAKIDALVELEKPEEAEQYLDSVLNDTSSRINSVSGEPIPPVTINDLNRMALMRLQHKLQEKCGRDGNFKIPKKSPRESQENEVEVAAVN